MPNLIDYRSNASNDTSFYVYDDLRAWQKGLPGTIYRYDTLLEAIEKFRALPANMTSALGISYRKTQEVDLVQTNRGEPFLVSDYLHMDFVKNITDSDTYLKTVIRELNLKWKSEYKLFGRNLAGVLIPIEEGNPDLSYLQNKILHSVDEQHPVRAIREFFNEGIGWQSFEETMHAAQVIYGNTREYRKPRISKLAVDYLEQTPHSDRSRIGNMDISIAGYRMLLEKTLIKNRPEFDMQLDAVKRRQMTSPDENTDRQALKKQKDGGEHER